MPFKDPGKRRRYQRDRKRLRRAGDPTSTPCTTRLPTDFRVQTAADVLALLDDEIAAVRAAADLAVLDRARCVGFLAGVVLRACEQANLAARLEALEDTLKDRQAEPAAGRSTTQ